MHITADIDACQGYGNCAALDPLHFDVDADGIVVILEADVDPDMARTTDAAVRSCPAAAIAIAPDGPR